MAESEESQSLVAPRAGSSEASYGAEEGRTNPAEQTGSPAKKPATEQPSKKRSWWNREKKLQRLPSLDKVEENPEAEAKDKPKRRSFTDYVGVRSYLHNFYDARVYKDPEVYEDEDDFGYLLQHGKRQRRCTSIWWKVFVWIGANFLIFGIIGVLVGYLVPQKAVIIDTYYPNLKGLNREAIAYNYNLDVCKLVGLILFCVGGLTLAFALLFPSFFYRYCDDEKGDGSFKVHAGEKEPLKSPVEMVVPACSKVSEVQPQRKPEESVATLEGMIVYKD